MGQKYTNINELYQQVRERVDLSEKIGDSSDMKRLSGELRNASKTHLAQSVRVKAHYDEMRKKVSDEVFRKLYNQFHGIFVIIAELKNASETHLKQAKKLDAFIKLKELSESFISEQPEHEITVGNYTTKHFFMCGSAQTTMKKHADKDGAEELTKMQDDFYKMEKDAMDAGGASDEQKEKSQELYDKIIAKAKEVGIADEVDKYMKMHLDSMLKGDPKLGFGRTDIKESIQEDGHQDVASAIRQCKIIAEDAMQILQKLQTMSPEDSLPTWWTNKLAVTSNSMNKMRDYLLVPSVSEEVELDEKFTKKDFAKNEDENQHTENAIELVKMFGTSAENIKVNAIAARHNMKGSISRKDQQDRDALIKKYYPKLKEGLELDEDAKMAKQSDDNLKSMMKKMRAYAFAKKKYGITIDPKEIDDKVATGPRKPSKGKVNKYRLKGDKGTVQIQVTNLDNKRFELNMYKEEVNMNEAKYKYDGKVVKISKKEFAKVHKDYKNSTKGKERMMILDPKTQGSISVPVKFEELDATVESVVQALSAGDNVREQRRMSPAARARRDALRDMDARKKGSDDEVKATDADREKADRNIINKLKKAADVKNEKGSFEIKFDKGPARKVPSKLASLVLQKFNKLKPADKLKFQKQAEKSYADFLRAVKDMTK